MLAPRLLLLLLRSRNRGCCSCLDTIAGPTSVTPEGNIDLINGLGLHSQHSRVTLEKEGVRGEDDLIASVYKISYDVHDVVCN